MEAIISSCKKSLCVRHSLKKLHLRVKPSEKKFEVWVSNVPTKKLKIWGLRNKHVFVMFLILLYPLESKMLKSKHLGVTKKLGKSKFCLVSHYKNERFLVCFLFCEIWMPAQNLFCQFSTENRKENFFFQTISFFFGGGFDSGWKTSIR